MRYIAQANVSYSTTDWTNTAQWKEADGLAITGAPTVSDFVYANNRTVIMDVVNTYGTITTRPYTGTVNSAVAGGGFNRNVSGVHSGSVLGGTTTGLTVSGTGVNCAVDYCEGGTVANIYGINNLSTGMISITTAQGGGVTNAHGIINSQTGSVFNIISAIGGNGSVGFYNNALALYFVIDEVYGSLLGSGGYGVNNAFSTPATAFKIVARAGASSYGYYNGNTGSLFVREAYGGSGNNTYGIWNNTTATIIADAAYGGTGNVSHGIYNASQGFVSVVSAFGGTNSGVGVVQTFIGTISAQRVFGGTSLLAYGIRNDGNGLVICKDVVGFPPPPASYDNISSLPSWIQININSTSPGAPGIYNAALGPCYFYQAFYGTFGGSPYLGNCKAGLCDGTYSSHTVIPVNPVIQATKAASNIWTNAGIMVDMVEQTEEGLVPVESDVREGIQYGSAGAYTGTLVVPDTRNVSLNVPVDNTVGEGIITVDDMRPLLTR